MKRKKNSPERLNSAIAAVRSYGGLTYHGAGVVGVFSLDRRKEWDSRILEFVYWSALPTLASIHRTISSVDLSKD